MTGPLVLLVIGLALSAFFSGSETGFYRATRVRIVIDALEGDWISRGLLWLTNNAAFFVATTLVGNNIANYITSLAIVLLTKYAVGSEASAAEITATVLFSPIVFVYGESLPKYLYYNAPNLLLRRGGPLFLLFAILFTPISGVLWLLSLALQKLLGETPLRVQLALARKELQEVLEEGHEVGVLQPAQRRVAQNLFALGTRPVGAYARPLTDTFAVVRGQTREVVLEQAKRRDVAVLAVQDETGTGLVGYLRVVDVAISSQPVVDDVRPLIRIRSGVVASLEAVLQLWAAKEDMAILIDDQGNEVGLLHTNALSDLLFDRS